MGIGALEVNKESGSREPGFGCPGKGLTLLHIFFHKFSVSIVWIASSLPRFFIPPSSMVRQK